MEPFLGPFWPQFWTKKKSSEKQHAGLYQSNLDGIYLLQVKNRNTRKQGVKYVQSYQ